MLVVTPAALERLSHKLSGRGAGTDAALRFKRAERRWRLHLDRVSPDDATYTHEGRQVLLLDEDVARAMNGMTLTVRDTEAGPRLRLRKARRTEG